MNTPDSPDWIAEHETASGKLARYGDALQQLHDIHREQGSLLDASLVAFEQAELHLRLRESPAARLVIEMATVLAQLDLETTRKILETVGLDTPYEPFIHVHEAKYLLRAAMEEREAVPRDLVRQLTLQYLGNAPTYVMDSTKDIDAAHKRKHLTRVTKISTGGGNYVRLRLDTVKDFGSTSSSPPQKRRESKTIREKLFLFDCRSFVEILDLDPLSEENARAMAQRLLDLPDDPIYLDNNRSDPPEASLISRRLEQLDVEEQKWLREHPSTAHRAALIKKNLGIIRAERDKILN